MWRHLCRLSLNPTNSVNALRKSSPFPRIPEKAMGRTVFDGAWVTCLPMNQPLCPGRWRSLNGQVWVIHPPPGIGPTYMICPVRWAYSFGVPKGKSRSALQNMGRWRLAHCRSHGFKAYATLIILSLCVLWCVSFFVYCSGFRE